MGVTSSGAPWAEQQGLSCDALRVTIGFTISESTPKAHSNVSVHADSHGVTFDFVERSPDDDTGGGARAALDFRTVFRSP